MHKPQPQRRSSSHQAPQASTASRGWAWAATLLWKAAAGDRRCAVPTTDWIVHRSAGDDSAVRWLTTNKNGAIARRKLKLPDGSPFPAAEISERFVRLAARWAALGGAARAPGDAPFIAVLVFRDGTRQPLTPVEFQQWLDTLESGGGAAATAAQRVAGLQAYIPPSSRSLAPACVAAMYSSSSSESGSRVDLVCRDAHCTAPSSNDDAPAVLPSRLRKEVESAALAVVDALQRASGERVVSGTFEFVVDCEQKLWLTHIEQLEAWRRGDASGESVSSPVEQTSLGARKQSLPTLQANSSSSASDTSGARCRGEFCTTAPALLPGLFCVSPSETDEHEGEDNNSRSAGAAALPDTGQRFKIGNNNVQLAHAEMSFLQGRVGDGGSPGESPAERALRWQEADNVLRTELGRANPTQFYKQVAVCANCFRVYSELNRARANGFRQPAGAATPHDAMVRPSKSTSALKAAPPSSTPSGTDPSTALYDQLFLAELAKHDDGGDGDAGRPEREDASGRPPSRSERPSLPSLSLAKSSKKKPSAAGGRSSSNQLPGSAGDEEEELRSLRTRVAKLEQELEQTRAKTAALESQKQHAEQRCLQIQTQCTTMLQEKDERVRRQLLELEAAHSAQQSRSRPPASTTSAGEVGKLVETIEALSAQLDQLAAAKDREKAQAVHAHQLELKRLHDTYQRDMETLRLGEHAAKEQVEALHVQLLNLQNEAHVASAQARSAKATLEELTTRRLAPLEETNRRLERQVAELTAAAQAGSPAASSAHAHALEALERHMGNKIEYLKAQLASEMKCKEELGAHLAQVALAMEQLKQEKRQALLEQEDAFTRQSQRAEASAAQERDAVATQHAALQGKLATLQANVTDLVQELTLWKSKEAHARLAVDKLGEENVRLARQLAELEQQLETLREQRAPDAGSATMSAKSASDETQRMQTDALLRRLDNERQYLKNQLESEQEAKEASQRQAAALQSELAQLQSRLELAAKESETALSAERTERLGIERQLRESVECLDESKQLLVRQLREVHAKFALAREQALVDRDELEKTRVEALEARAQLAAARDELAGEKAAAASASERSAKALALVKSSLRALEEEKARQLERLEAENALYVTRLADAQAETLVLADRWAVDTARAKKQHALARLALVLRSSWTRHRARQQTRALHLLALTSKLTHLQETLGESHAAAAQQLEERLRGEWEEQCDLVTQSLNDERLDALRQLKERHDCDREELHQYYEQEKAQLLEDAARAQQERAERQEQTHVLATRALEERAARDAAALVARAATLERERDALATAVAELQTRCEELNSKLEALALETEQQRAARESEWTRETQELCDALERRAAETEASAAAREEELTRQHALQTQELRDAYAREHAMSIQRALDEARGEATEQVKALAETHAAELAEAEAQHQRRIEEETRELSARWQQELSDAREAHERALKSALERAESRAQSQLDALQKELTDRKGHAVVQCTAKWQKALEELQERLEVEKSAAYERGLQDREGEWQQAAGQIKLKQKDELESVQQEALRAIQAAEERHAMHFQAKLELLAREADEKRRSDAAQLSAEITVREERKARLALELEVQQVKAELEVAHGRELETLKDEHHARLALELGTLAAAAEQEKQRLVERLEAAKERALADAESEWVAKLEEAAREKDAQAQRSLEELRRELSDDYEHDSQQLRATLERETAARLTELESRLLSEQEEAIAQVQDDSERLIEKVELAMTQLKAQKDAMEGELVKLRSALEEAEDAHFDAEEQRKTQRKHAAFHLLSLLMHARKRLEGDAQTHVRRMLELQSKLDDLESDHTRERKQRGDEMAQVRATWGQVQSKHEEMLRTLTSYKRDELVAHRSASGVLANEISIVSKQMDEVREMQAGLEKEIEQLQSEAQSVEASLRQLMVQNESSSSSSGLNMAVVAKKRRLNEEFEALLEQIERKKAEVRSVEKTFGALQTRRDAKELEMKAMERKLVEILVQQQKQLLALLSAVRELAVPSSLIGESAVAPVVS